MSEPRQYTGKKNCCSICERHFTVGEPVFVNEADDVVFCYSSVPSGANCHVRWMFENPHAFMMVTMLYAGTSGK